MPKLRLTAAIVLDLDLEIADTQGVTEFSVPALAGCEDSDRLLGDVIAALEQNTTMTALIRTAGQLVAYVTEKDIDVSIDVWPMAARCKIPGGKDVDGIVDMRTVIGES